MSKAAFRAVFMPLLLVWGLLAPVAAESPDRALFWSISWQGEPCGYLLGTIHSEDPRVLEFGEDLLGRLSDSRIFAMELVPDLPTLAALTERMQLPPGRSLAEIAGESRFRAVAEALADYGVPMAQAERMHPWAAMMTLSVPPPETGLFMDFSLSLRAAGAGVKVVGLETLGQQLAFLEGMDESRQLRLLDHALGETGRAREVHDAMLAVYLDNDLPALQRMALDEMSSLDADLRELFMRQGIDARNRRMLESALPYLADGPVFIAVGALHLPGPVGLIALLREQGYVLEPAAWPFSARP